MECSFCIWLARNNKDWTPSTANCHLNDPSKETCNSPSSLSSLKQTIKLVSNTKLIRPVGINERKHMLCKFHLEGLKCCVKPLEQSPLRIKHISPMLRAISLDMTVKKNPTKHVDPSNFLWASKHKLSIIRGGVPFNFNTQQDVAEILLVNLDELKGISIAASHLICNTHKKTVSCNTCFCSSVSEENLVIVKG